MECTSCGATIDHRDAFCSKCGTLRQAGQPIRQTFGVVVAKVGNEFHRLSTQAFAYVRDEANRKWVIGGIGAAAVLLFVATDNPLSSSVIGPISGSDDLPAVTAEGLPDFDAYQDQFLSEETEFIVSGIANVRDFPTSQGTSITHTFAGGEAVLAREVRAFDPSSKWYKLSSGGYIWGANLEDPGHTQETPSSGQAAIEFPNNLRGRWSSMDTCRGWDLNTEIVISENAISFYEATGSLAGITYDDRGQAIYELAMSGEGETWIDRYMISITANGFSLFLDKVGKPGEPSQVYHNPQAGCGRVFFVD